MEQYIEDKQIRTVIQLDEKTPSKADMVKVIFEDDTDEAMPKLRFELLVTEEISDATNALQTLVGRVSSLCFGALHEYGVKRGEVNVVMDGVVGLVNDGFNKAQDILWGFDSENIPLIEVNKVLLRNVQTDEDNNNGVETAGGGSDSEDKD
jgi:hypothetical protein